MNTTTRDQRLAELQEMKAPQLNEVMQQLNIGIKVGQTNEAKIEAILAVTHGGDQNPPNQQQTSPPDAPPPAEPTPPSEDKEPDPTSAQVAKIDLALEELHRQLIEKVQEAAKNGVNSETAEAIRAGAVDFLKAANATLEEARQVNEGTKGVAAELSAQRQGIEKAKQDLMQRAESYKTNVARNAQEREQIEKAQKELDNATRRG